MNNPITQSETQDLLLRVREGMIEYGIPQFIVDGTTIEIIHPENWEVSVFVPYSGVKVGDIRKAMDKVLFDVCNIERQCCDYLGRQTKRKALEWYFRHPNTPKEIYERLEAEMEAELGEDVGFGLPIPSGFVSNTDTCFLSLKDEFFRLIASGEKKEEYRTLNQYYCDKFFSQGIKKRFVKFNRGYIGGVENQMVFEIDRINIVSSDGREISAYDSNGELIVSYGQLPENFAPEAYGIVLGKRIS